MSVARLPGSRYLALAVLAMLPALALVAGDSRLPVPGYLPLHQVLEAVSIFVAFAVFATVCWSPAHCSPPACSTSRMC
jgi:hypothetical protein